MPKSSQTKSRARRGLKTRTHNLGGCATCRRRHVKCDREKPVCGICTKAGLQCEGFQNGISWASSSHEDAEPNTRRHLYTEQSREHMVTALSSSLTSGCVDATLLEIDNRVRDSSLADKQAHNLGPFGFFSITPAPVSGTSPAQSARLPKDSSDQISTAQHVIDIPTGESISDLDSVINLGNSLDWTDLFDIDLSFMDNDPGISAWDPFADLDFAPDTFDAQSAANDIDVSHSAAVGSSADNAGLLHDAASESKALQNAPNLLKHFKYNVISIYKPVPTDVTSPWELPLNAAVKTLADLTFMENLNVTHASKANFFGILACSAYHESVSLSDPEASRGIAEYCSVRAKKEMQQSLVHETSGPKKAKYKDQLMAIFSLTAYATDTGNQNDARCYIVDSEKLLRVRGLAKREVSRRARLLHHVYSWVRIVGESTFVLHEYTRHALVDKVNEIFRSHTHHKADDRTDRQTELDDFLRVQDPDFNSDVELDDLKDQEGGLRDIHLEDVRDDRNSLYMKIYGIPETWLSLISQTTRLANILDIIAANTGRCKSQVVASVQRKVDRLEHLICTFASRKPRSSTQGVTGPETDADSKEIKAVARSHMIDALNSALVIFYYRRVRKVHPLILQGHVRDVVESLGAFEQVIEQHHVTALRTPWPAFMAGCEALDSSAQRMLMGWLERSVAQSGVKAYVAAQDVMREVWKSRGGYDGDGGTARTGVSPGKRKAHSSWVDVSRNSTQWLMLY